MFFRCQPTHRRFLKNNLRTKRFPFCFQLNKYGREEITFSHLAKIWEENEYDVIIEPAGLLWPEMAAHWPQAKLLHLTRDEESWRKSFWNFHAEMLESNQTLEVVLSKGYGLYTVIFFVFLKLIIFA